MRKLSPLKAVSHALKSVITYRSVGIRFGLFWIPVLFVLGLIELNVGVPDPESMQLGAPALVQLVSVVVSFAAFCSMAVNWHRFILRDETGHPARLDRTVWRYVGNSLAIMLMVFLPIAVLVTIVASLPPLASVLLIPASLAAGAVVTGLSIKLPAVALGRTDFSFGDAWRATANNHWQLLGVFLLNAVIVFAAILLLVAILNGIGLFSTVLAEATALVLGAILQLFYALFNASIFTSLYGFFVERRDF